MFDNKAGRGNKKNNYHLPIMGTCSIKMWTWNGRIQIILWPDFRKDHALWVLFMSLIKCFLAWTTHFKFALLRLMIAAATTIIPIQHLDDDSTACHSTFQNCLKGIRWFTNKTVKVQALWGNQTVQKGWVSEINCTCNSQNFHFCIWQKNYHLKLKIS